MVLMWNAGFFCVFVHEVLRGEQNNLFTQATKERVLPAPMLIRQRVARYTSAGTTVRFCALLDDTKLVVISEKWEKIKKIEII